MRGNGNYPQWEITFSVTRALGLPTQPLRRLWTAAAHEAQKEDDWIRRSIQKVAHEGEGPPLPHQAFTEAVGGAYTDYARAFLLTDRRARWVVSPRKRGGQTLVIVMQAARFVGTRGQEGLTAETGVTVTLLSHSAHTPSFRATWCFPECGNPMTIVG